MTARLVVITGAGGFVCSQIAIELAAAGYAVVATDRDFDSDARLRLGAMRLVEGEISEVLMGLDGTKPFAVVHGAAITASPAALGITAAAHVRRNMDMLTCCLAWARSTGSKRFIFLSSTGVFRAEDGAGPLSELSPATARGPYSAAKKAGEILVQGAADSDFDTVSLRLGNMFGFHETPRQSRPGLGLIAQMVASAMADGIIHVETPEARRDWTWLPDIGRAIAALLDTFPAAGTDVLHCGSLEMFTDLELATAIAERLPGTKIKANLGIVAPTKGPMGSAVQTALSAFNWTPVADGLAKLTAQERAA